MNIEFDYRFDTNGFFNDPDRKATLEAAASIWESLIEDDFDSIPVGIEFTVRNPQTVDGEEQVVLDAEIDDLLVFVGAVDLSLNKLGLGGPSGSAVGSIFDNRFNSSDFEPWIGVISFDLEPSGGWFFDRTPEDANDLIPGSNDFLNVALHEIGHVLGIGTADIFQEIAAGGSFDGTNALNPLVNGGQPIPLDEELEHVEEGFLSNGQPVLMDPTNSDGSTDTLAFSAAEFQVNENNTSAATVTIVRTGDSEGEISATIALGASGDRATPSDDYDSSSITLNFLSGETSKTIIVPIVDDELIEGNQKLSLTLTDISDGASLGSQQTANLEILDDEEVIQLEKTLFFGTLDSDTFNLASSADPQIVFSGAKNDRINTELINTESQDRIYGGSGGDLLVAGANDRLFGGKGNDTLDASAGMIGNRLYGGAGNDLLLANENDFLIGGSGSDEFIVSSSKFPEIINVVGDFEDGNDLIKINNFNFNNIAGVQVFSDGDDALITAVSSGLVRINVAKVLNIDASLLTVEGGFFADTFVIT